MSYEIHLRKSGEVYSASCPELPGCWSQGATEEEAREKIQIAIREYMDAQGEIARRDAELTSGAVTGRSHEEVMRAARRAIGSDRL